MIETICAWTYDIGDALARVAAAFALMGVAMALTPMTLDGLVALRRWRRAGRER